ncbi:DUF6036 family nucleotidyltransferase [Defluviimonas salinarum]|uniref:DUF6036 domain-containing protein n=1 Tax=Defluviimonas salinarum TaxID=2992147 RepID=A0ABT3J5Q5_9RHOB|nr:DUF6036 family nucleotidyltransferase [Defluviimonas salinarum]MCW3783022.1 hypothetical protein [Defluviimonas salinarum]
MIDREKLHEVLAAIGRALEHPARITIVGSGAGMLSGQDDRQTPDIDVWYPTSDFDISDLRNACLEAGLLFDPKGHVEADQMYLQIMRPGITMLPKQFETEVYGRFGNLTVTLPPPELIIATKLARASVSDLEDTSWWVANSDVTLERIAAAIGKIPQAENRETATENLVLVEIAMASRGNEKDDDDDCEP